MCEAGLGPRWLRPLVIFAFASCGAPAPIDVGALLARRGPVEGRRDLQIRVLADGKDIQARLALAELDDRTGWPGDALEQLDAVVALGGLRGTRWHETDRARYAKLLAARGRAELVRPSPHALADLERARELGQVVSAVDLEHAREAAALAELRHVDAEVRARGRTLFAKLPVPEARGATPGATPAERARFGAWLWQHGARREGYEQLAAWFAATASPRDGELEQVYACALAWWVPADAPPPAPALATSTECDPSPPVAPAVLFGATPYERAAMRYVRERVPESAHEQALVGIVRAFARDPEIADRLGRELVARAFDTATAHAEVAAVFEALADPARARAAWQAAVDESPDPAFVRGLAEAAARAGDGPAAAVFATQAAAAWGDPALVWIGVARALHDDGRDVDALAAAHSAIELAGRAALPQALALAAAASRALGRTAQADALAAHAPPPDRELADALADHAAHPTAATVARLWVVSRAHPGDLASRIAIYTATSPADPRHAAIADELVGAAGDAEIGLAAVQALAH
ncbi:MAG TPA: hypothetical protein VGF94_14945 [Kofleriaceae bacterium]|jgi:hypothetical protein